MKRPVYAWLTRSRNYTIFRHETPSYKWAILDGEIATARAPREGDGGARGNNGDATDDANRGTDDGGDGEGNSDVEVDG